jgi:hypothetical protein
MDDVRVDDGRVDARFQPRPSLLGRVSPSDDTSRRNVVQSIEMLLESDGHWVGDVHLISIQESTTGLFWFAQMVENVAEAVGFVDRLHESHRRPKSVETRESAPSKNTAACSSDALKITTH